MTTKFSQFKKFHTCLTSRLTIPVHGLVTWLFYFVPTLYQSRKGGAYEYLYFAIIREELLLFVNLDGGLFYHASTIRGLKQQPSHIRGIRSTSY